MKIIRLPLCLALLAIFLPMLTGCWQDIPEEDPADQVIETSPPEEEEPPSAANTLPTAFSLAYNPDDTLDPLTCRDGAQLTLTSLLYEGLFQLDESFQPLEKLCDGYECNESKTVWTFRIREDVLFSDGTQLTAADVVSALTRARESDRYRARLSSVTKLSQSGNAVIVTLDSPNALFPALLDIPIVKKGTESRSVPVGTGPYLFSDEDGSAALVPAETWWGTISLPTERIPLTACSGSTALYHRFSSRSVQLLVTDLTGRDAFTPTGSIAIRDANTTILQFIGFNTARSLFSSADLRNALGLGIDRATLVNTYLAGHAAEAQSPVSPVSPLYPDVLDRDYSSAAFLEAMDAAGYHTGTIREATLLVNSENSFKTAAAQFLADTLSVCDIKITVNALPWEEYTAALAAGDFDLYYGEVKLTADWDLSQLVGTGGSMNYSNYSNAAMDALLAGYASADEPEIALRSLCRYLQAQAPILPLCFKCSSVLTESGVVEGLSPTAADPFYSLENIVIHLSENK